MGAIELAIKGIGWLWEQAKEKFEGVKGFISDLIDAFFEIKDKITEALKGVVDAITKPFKEAFDKLGGMVDGAKGALNKLNPFHRESPSLVDWITKGTEKITGLYSGMVDNISGISTRGRTGLTGAVRGATGAVSGTTGQSPIATQGTVVNVEMSGMMARSKNDMRDIFTEGIEAVNDNLKAKNMKPINI